MNNNKFKEFYEQLEIGYKIYFYYTKKQYLVFKTAENCYTLELKTIEEKSPHPVSSMITLKTLKEMYPFIENIEYKAEK